MSEIKRNGWVLTASGRVWLSGPNETVTLTEARRRVRASNKDVRYSDSHDGGSDEPWETPQ